MENTLTTLKIECVKAGTNLTQLCKKAGISRTTIDRWEKELPKSLKVLDALRLALEEIKTEKSA